MIQCNVEVSLVPKHKKTDFEENDTFAMLAALHAKGK